MSHSNLITRDSDHRTSERGVPVARIRIDDLPVAEELTPEQEELIQGAGLRSFRPSLEALEARDVPTAVATGIVLTNRVVTISSSVPDSQVNSANVWTNNRNQVVVQRGTGPAVFLARSQVDRIVYEGAQGIVDTFRNNTSIPSEFVGILEQRDVHTQNANAPGLPSDMAGFNLTSDFTNGLPQSSASGRSAGGGQLLVDMEVGGQRLGDVVVPIGQRLVSFEVSPGRRLGDVEVSPGRTLDDVTNLRTGQRLRDVVGTGQRIRDMVIGDPTLGTDYRLAEVAVGGTRIGQNIHPSVEWRNVPLGTSKLVAIMRDATAGGYAHSVIFDIPENTREIRGTADGGLEGWTRADPVTGVKTRTFSIAPGASSDPATGTRVGVDGNGRRGYNGPNPTDGLPHTYVWTLYALKDQIHMPPSGRAEDVERTIDSYVIGQTSVQGTFQYPPGQLLSDWR